MVAMTMLIGCALRNEPRRRFTNNYKREVVQERLESQTLLSRAVSEHDLNHNQRDRGRREYGQGKYASASNQAMEFVSGWFGSL